MTVAPAPDLTLAHAARMMRESVKDRSYRATPLGLEVARYIRWKRSEWGATKGTIRDYESILARTALFFADLDLPDFAPPVGTERLRECWDHHWGEAAGRTRAKVRSVWVDFFQWAEDNRGLYGNPARRLASPKKRDVQREPYTSDFVAKVIEAQEYLPDKLGVHLILRCALRRAEIAGVQFKHFDFERRQLFVTGKGGAVRYVPIRDPVFWRELAEVQLELQTTGENFLIHHRRKTGMKWYRYPAQGYAVESIGKHWWYDRLEEAGVVADGVRHGLHMHRGRHTVATDILRKTGNTVAAQKMLGHKNPETTIQSYVKFDVADLARVLDQMMEMEA